MKAEDIKKLIEVLQDRGWVERLSYWFVIIVLVFIIVNLYSVQHRDNIYRIVQLQNGRMEQIIINTSQLVTRLCEMKESNPDLWEHLTHEDKLIKELMRGDTNAEAIQSK